MQITFMIGNGFDLNCGLKCSFKDAYAVYCQTPSSNELIEHFKKTINDDIEDWGDFEVAMSNCYSRFDSEESFVLCLRDFKQFLVGYLKDEEGKFKALYDDNNFIKRKLRDEIHHSINTFYQDITNDLTYMVDNQTGEYIYPFHDTETTDLYLITCHDTLYNADYVVKARMI